ncbi:metallophosphoesterase [Rhodopirellula sp. P2]|uniref:metallophosphoesterase n=1 Tax=Rhodopirellula sp. P2 TaxID=2127060 RepID=UPI0023688573|nr:metallophosphoesterase [Rhodopirellula sp. P2]WDQ19018.1 metallophosphoesterase [Rhodopirellula sp. P2]
MISPTISNRLFFSAIVFNCCITSFLSADTKGAEQPVLTAVVIEVADPWTGQVGLQAGLEAAGFEVATIDLQQDTLPEADLIAVGSFASEEAAVRKWLENNRKLLGERVAAGAVLLELTQADQTESSIAFLPDSLSASRTDRDGNPVIVHAPQHPLLQRLPRDSAAEDRLLLPNHHRAGSWETLRDQQGFAVLAALGKSTRDPVLLEASHGEGRIVLTSLFFDKWQSPDGKTVAPARFVDASKSFFRGLQDYVRMVQNQRAPAVDPTPSYQVPEPLPFVVGSATIVALPDTQIYSQHYPQHFLAQTRWIRQHLKDRNIVAVFHEGDITNRNTPDQWENAQQAMDELFGHVPVIAAPGNHDMGPGGNGATHESLMSDYLDEPRFARHPSFQGTMDPGKTENNYSLFETDHAKWIGIALEWAPRDRAVKWADQLLTEHSDRLAVIVTHAYMYYDETKYDWKRTQSQTWSPYKYGVADSPEGINDAGDLWTKLISDHPNVMMVLSGHVLNDGAGLLSEKAPQGNLVHQMLANYQMLHEGGDGWMRLIELLPDGKSIQVRTYSPVFDQYNTDPEHQFTLPLVVGSPLTE